jgi:hypothetical protein
MKTLIKDLDEGTKFTMDNNGRTALHSSVYHQTPNLEGIF